MLEHRRLYLITFFEKFTVNGFRSILILYAINFLKMNPQQAFECIGAALGMGFLTPILGGFLANWLQSAKAVIILGLILMIISTSMLFLFHGSDYQYIYLCLALLVLGTGFVRSNVPALLGKYQQNNNSDIFTKFYIYLNIGSLLGVLCCGTISEIYGWKIGFILSTLACTIALGFALSLNSHKKEANLAFNKKSNFKAFFWISVSFWIVYSAVNKLSIFNILNIILLISTLIYLFTLVYKQKKFSSYNLYHLILFAVVHLVFLALYEQGSYSLMLFIEKYVDRRIPDFIQALSITNIKDFPVSSFQLIDPFLNILLGGLMLSLWRFLNRKGIIVDTVHKFVIGLFITCLAFLFLFYSINEVEQVTYWHIISVYGLFVLTELCFIPTGLSFVNKIALPEKRALFMGFWHMGMGFSQWLALNLAKITITPKPDQTCIDILTYQSSFLSFAYIALGVMIILIFVKTIENVYFKKTNPKIL